MTEISADLAAFASAELRRRGIEIRTNTQIREVTDRVRGARRRRGRARAHRGVDGGRQAGARSWPSSGCRSTDGRIAVDRFTRGPRPSRRLGDRGRRGAVPDPARKRQTASPPTAQHVLRQAKVAADNVAARAGRGAAPKRPFRYRTLGVFVDMGRHQAVAETFGIKWRGFPRGSSPARTTSP